LVIDRVMYTDAAVAIAVKTQVAGGVRRMREGYRIGPTPEDWTVLSCYCEKVRGLRKLITEALATAQWPFRDDGPPLAIGTSLFHDGMIVGGSIQVFEDVGVVRVIAFGAVGDPGACRAGLDELIGLLNPSLIDVNFEIDLVLQMPVCRSVVRIERHATDEEVAEDVIRTLGSVTANFVAAAPAFLAVTSDGLGAHEARERMQQVDDDMKIFAGRNSEGN